MNPRIRCPRFPVVYSGFVYPDLLGNLLLEEAEVEAAFAEMTTDGSEGLWVPNR